MAHLKLFDVKSGTVRVRSWAGGPGEEKRLADLGLHPGARVEVEQHSGENGRLVAMNDDARIVGLSRPQIDCRQKLMSMGLTPGIEFEITRVAPEICERVGDEDNKTP
ncbi:FeoA domain-containing protein [Xanthobacter sediminis]